MTRDDDPQHWVGKMDSNADPEKHADERAAFGFSEYDWWNFNSYLSWVILQGLARFAERGAGWPALCGTTREQWLNLIGVMEEGFMLQLREDETPGVVEAGGNEWLSAAVARERKINTALDVFGAYYQTLWD